MATPPFLLAIGWIMLLSPRTGAINHVLMSVFGLAAPPFNIYSLSGMIFVEGLALVPSAFLIISPAVRNIDPSLEESALTSGAGTVRLMLRIVLPLLLPALLGTAIFLMIVSFVVFDIPGTIGMPSRIFVLSSQIYSLVTDSPQGIPEYGKVSAMALLFTAGLLTLAFAYHRLMRQSARFVTVTGKGYRPRPFKLGRWRWLAVAGVSAYFLCAVLLPLSILLWTSFMPYQGPISLAAAKAATLSNHREFFHNPFIEVGHRELDHHRNCCLNRGRRTLAGHGLGQHQEPRAGTQAHRRAFLPPAGDAGRADRDRADLRLPMGENRSDLRDNLDYRRRLSHDLLEFRLARDERSGIAAASRA